MDVTEVEARGVVHAVYYYCRRHMVRVLVLHLYDQYDLYDL